MLTSLPEDVLLERIITRLLTPVYRTRAPTQ